MEERLEDILDILKKDGKVKVKDLRGKFNVSEEDDCIFLDIASTNYMVSNMMANFNKKITIITNMNRIAMDFDFNPNIDIIQIGGSYNKSCK